MLKILLIQNTISNYRIPIYNKLSEVYDLTAIYSYGNPPVGHNFKVEKIETHKRWKFTIHNKSLHKLAQKYDIVLGLFSPTWLSISSMPFRGGRHYKFIPWGIGVPASYSVRYDDPSKNTSLIRIMIKHSDAVVFYSDYPVEKYSKMGYIKEKMFVAYNTVEVIKNDYYENINRNTILFIGSLYSAKGIFELLEQYNIAYRRNNILPKLIIIGEGDDYNYIVSWITTNHLEERIVLLGSIYDENVLKSLFDEAIICVSPTQAGLSVQKSMGYGVPFVTQKESFTGGERFDIKNNINGILFENISDMAEIFIETISSKEKYAKMGKIAHAFYWNNRKIDNMAKGVIDAITYAITKGK